MMEIKQLNEEVTILNITPTMKVTPTIIDKALYKARNNYMYAKFYVGKYFIQVNFLKDNTINVSSNIMSSSFIADYRRRMNDGWTYATVKSFLYQWLQLSRSIIY